MFAKTAPIAASQNATFELQLLTVFQDPTYCILGLYLSFVYIHNIHVDIVCICVIRCVLLKYKVSVGEQTIGVVLLFFWVRGVFLSRGCLAGVVLAGNCWWKGCTIYILCVCVGLGIESRI